jgi:hypothetical protein
MMLKCLKEAAVRSALVVLLFLPLSALPQDNSRGLAATTGLPLTLSITDYDVSLRTDVESDTLFLRVVCAIRNQSPEPVGQIDFDLFSRERFYGVRVKVAAIAKLADGALSPLAFSHGPLVKPADPTLEGSDTFPKITRVSLAAPLRKGEETRLQFEYAITHVDSKKKDLPYRIIADLSNGLKEICLITDFSWLPWITWNEYEKIQILDKSNFFIKMPRPTWRIAVRHPSSYQTLVVDGRLEKIEPAENDTISTWACRTGGMPQLMIGRSDKIEVKDEQASVIFLLAKGAYEPSSVEAMGKFLIRAFRFYSQLFGELAGNEMHIAASSAGMGGHGAFLGTFLDIQSFQKKDSGPSSAGTFDETAAHELAHSWWGISISSYGRGTKFLREAFCNFGTWLFAKDVFQMDLFQDNLAYLFFRGTAKNRLFEETSDNANLAYTKGALVLDILRQEMGDETFYRILKLFASRYKDAYVTFTDFVSLCNEVTLRDWMPFFIQWCYGEGYPVYHLLKFESMPDGGRWKTTLVIRNDGKGVILCPLELVQGEKSQEEMFFVREGTEKALTYDTPAQVDKVILDPRHRIFQGDEKEARLKLLGIKETNWAWMNYFMGILQYERGDRNKGLELLSKAISGHEEILGPRKASPALYFSRGLLYLRMDEKEKADKDISLFLDGIFGTQENPRDLAAAVRGLTYAVVVSGTAQERQDQFQQILKAVTGENIGLDPKLAEWRKWWEANRSKFKVPKSAGSLHPKGYGK